ncbi:hypothetical protein HZC33_02300 [Candidatus Wolfebacteria bacterium]|nr:hypothetical protein [Candidatus Wolfebacteria bacterium]
MKKFTRPSWDEFFMFQAISYATRHSCLKRGVGAVLVKNNRIIGAGYNGAASGIENCRNKGCCHYEQLAFNEYKINGGSPDDLKEKFKIYCLAVHAEINVLSQCSRDEAIGSILYVTNYPCPKCVQDGIITKGVSRVMVWKQYLQNPIFTIDEKRASEQKLLEAGIPIKYVKMSKGQIMGIAAYMAKNIGKRSRYNFK